MQRCLLTVEFVQTDDRELFDAINGCNTQGEVSRTPGRTCFWRRGAAALLALLMATAGTAMGGGLEITSFDKNGELVFRTPDGGTAQHHYRLVGSTSVVSATWSTVRTVGGVEANVSVTNGVVPSAQTMFYGVVTTSNATDFVDGPYMAIDVSAGTDATHYAVAYYDSAAAVPGGVTNGLYQSDQILLRLIPRGSFAMGSPSDEVGRLADESQHQVTLSKDFYMGVFEVTQKQWERVMGSWPSYFTNIACRDLRPVEQVSYYDIRENPANKDDPGVNWPSNSVVNENSFIGRLRAKTGLSTLDLPTESQWEYACRAGTGTALHSGKNLTNMLSDARMSEVGRYYYDHPGGFSNSPGVSTSSGTAAVGTYPANAWGLCDMHGNVWEWCLDWYGSYPGNVQDPPGAGAGNYTYRVLRGGSWFHYAEYCRSGCRYDHAFPSNRFMYFGFRLARTLP